MSNPAYKQFINDDTNVKLAQDNKPPHIPQRYPTPPQNPPLSKPLSQNISDNASLRNISPELVKDHNDDSIHLKEEDLKSEISSQNSQNQIYHQPYSKEILVDVS